MENIPNLNEWMKDNPSKSLNDYYQKYPPYLHKNTTYILDNNTTIINQPIQQKSMILSIVLTLFFGPFGLLYTTITTALILIFTPLVGFFVGLMLSSSCERFTEISVSMCKFSVFYWGIYYLFICLLYPLSIIIGIVKVNKYNQTSI